VEQGVKKTTNDPGTPGSNDECIYSSFDIREFVIAQR